MQIVNMTMWNNTYTTRSRSSRSAAIRCLAWILPLAVGLCGPVAAADLDAAGDLTGLAEKLAVLGHRNWIVVADSAYPAQSRPGIETIYVGGDHAMRVGQVLRAVDAARHVRPVVYVDAELKHVAEADAPGIGAYRQKLSGMLKKRPVRTMPHEEVIARLDEAAKTFRIVILKTDMVMPYTTVFIELDCGYWSPAAEKRLRDAMAGAK